MANNDYCSRYVTGDCDKEITAVCGRFKVELVLNEPYVIFDVSDNIDVDNGSGEFYEVDAGSYVAVDANDDDIGDPNKLFHMSLKSDNVIEYIKFKSDTIKEIHILSGDDLNDASSMCKGLSELELFYLGGFNRIVNFNSMFENCTNLRYVNDFFVIPEDTSGPLTNTMEHMFSYCTSMTSEEFPNLDKSMTTNLNYAFNHMESMTLFPYMFSNQQYTANNMFSGSHRLKEFPVVNWKNITSCSEMYRYLPLPTAITDLDLSASVDVSRMFKSCYEVRTVYNMTLFDDDASNDSVKTSGMFTKCYQLKCVDTIDTTDSVDLDGSLFDGALRLLVPMPTDRELVEAGSGVDFQNTVNCPPIDSDKDFIADIYYKEEAGSEYGIEFITDVDIVVDWGNTIECEVTQVDVVIPGEEDGVYNPITCSNGDNNAFSNSYGSQTFAYKAGSVVKYQFGTPLDRVDFRPVKIFSISPLTEIAFHPNQSITDVVIHKCESLTNLDKMFEQSVLLETVKFPLGYSLAETANSAFAECSLMTSNNLFTGNITDMNKMFLMCSNLVVGNYDFDNSKATLMNSTFYGCDKLDRMVFSNNPVITAADYTFTGCTMLQCVNVFNTLGIGRVLLGTFDDCIHLEAPRFSQQDEIMSTTGMNYINDSGCPLDHSKRNFDILASYTEESISNTGVNVLSVTVTCNDDFGLSKGIDDYTVHRGGTSVTLAVNNGRNVPGFNIWSYGSPTSFNMGSNSVIHHASINKHITITSYSNVFKDNTELVELFVPDMLPAVVDADYAFYNTKLTKIPLDTRYLKNMSSMFTSCPLHFDITFDASSVESLEDTFKNCSEIRTVTVVGNSNKLTSLDGCFMNTSALSSIDNLNTENVTFMESTFENSGIEELSPIFVFDSCVVFTRTFYKTNRLACIKASMDTTNPATAVDMFNENFALVMPTFSQRDLLMSTTGYVYVNNYVGCAPTPDESNFFLKIGLRGRGTDNNTAFALNLSTAATDFFVQFADENDQYFSDPVLYRGGEVHKLVARHLTTGTGDPSDLEMMSFASHCYMYAADTTAFSIAGSIGVSTVTLVKGSTLTSMNDSFKNSSIEGYYIDKSGLIDTTWNNTFENCSLTMPTTRGLYHIENATESEGTYRGATVTLVDFDGETTNPDGGFGPPPGVGGSDINSTDYLYIRAPKTTSMKECFMDIKLNNITKVDFDDSCTLCLNFDRIMSKASGIIYDGTGGFDRHAFSLAGLVPATTGNSSIVSGFAYSMINQFKFSMTASWRKKDKVFYDCKTMTCIVGIDTWNQSDSKTSMFNIKSYNGIAPTKVEAGKLMDGTLETYINPNANCMPTFSDYSLAVKITNFDDINHPDDGNGTNIPTSPTATMIYSTIQVESDTIVTLDSNGTIKTFAPGATSVNVGVPKDGYTTIYGQTTTENLDIYFTDFNILTVQILKLPSQNTSIANMFKADYSSINKITFGSQEGQQFPHIISIENAFEGLSYVDSIVLNVPNLTSMKNAFRDSKFKKIHLSTNADLAANSFCYGAFYGATDLACVSGNFTTSTGPYNLFYNNPVLIKPTATEITSIEAGGYTYSNSTC